MQYYPQYPPRQSSSHKMLGFLLFILGLAVGFFVLFPAKVQSYVGDVGINMTSLTNKLVVTGFAAICLIMGILAMMNHRNLN